MRERVENAIRDALEEHHLCDPHEAHVARVVLDAALAVSGETTCETCGGTGSYAEHAEGCYGNCSKHGCPVQVQCRPCNGSGSVSTGYPVILELVGERAQWADLELDHRPVWVARAPEPS